MALNILIVSCCDCCSLGTYESLEHVLAIWDIVAKVWDLAETALGLPRLASRSWWAMVMHWFSFAKKSSQRGVLIGILPYIITWRLWVRHCKARMEEFLEPVESALDILFCSIRSRRAKLIYWFKPAEGWVKINVEGSCRGNPGTCGGGGVIQD
ncbi:uncharacterized protein LOC122291110 [Carya illinoinensis]|uniref:uncharacterized protein LOC122291110 n=1 Tax=Carya illinoinensis TaxID=32201 RepID=UPI001C71ED91|nr:uncharacterized protein LOC122291110 [Carya illinoinensis]